MKRDPERRVLYYQILIFLVLSAGIIISGYLYYQNYEQEFRTEVEHQLTSVGDLKVDELVRWRSERLGDAQVLYQNPAFSSLVGEVQKDPYNTQAHQDLGVWLSNVQSQYHYDRVYLLNQNGNILFSTPNTTNPISSMVLGNISRVLKTREIEFLDFYRDEYDLKIYLTILVPIIDTEKSMEPLGVVALQINPEDYLYPFISKWPTASSSAETLLFRRDGDSVLYLNELRFRPGTPLSLRLPLNQTELPAVKAALGQEGIVEGTDYRGVRVFANIRTVPGSPWFMVARIDSFEVFHPLQARALDLTIIVFFLLIGTGAGIYLLRQRENERFYREQFEIKEALRESEERLRLSLDAANDGIWDWNVPTGAIIFSPRWYTMLGYEPDEISLTYATWRSLIHPDDIDEAEQKISDNIQKKDPDYTVEYRMQTKQGGWIWTLARGKVIEWDASGDPIRMVGTHTDISNRKEAEIERERLIGELAQNNEQLGAAYEELSGSEEELRYQFDALASTEEHLRETSEYLENLITYANVPIIVWDPADIITRINHAFENLIGRTADEMKGNSLNILFPRDQIEHSMRLIKTTRAGVRWETVEIVIQHQDGTLRTVLWNSSTIYSSDGSTPVATIAQGQDITLRRRLKRENEISILQIQKNLAQLAILNDEIRNPLTVILMCAEMSDDIQVSSTIAEQTRNIDQMVNQLDQRWLESEKVLDMIRRNYQIYASPSVDQIIRSHEEIQAGEQISGSGDGSSLEPRRLLAEEIQAELYAILDSIDAFIFVAELETYELLYLNRLGRNLFGDIAGKTCFQVIQKGQSGPCPFCTNHLLTDEFGPTGVHLKETHNTRNGRWYECKDRVIRWNDGRFVHLQIATDITERRSYENSLRENEYTFRKLFEESSDPILLMQKDRFIECNQATLDLLGISEKEQFIGTTPMDISPEYQPDGRLSSVEAAEYMSQAHQEGHRRFEWMVEQYDGTLVLLEVSLIPIMFKGEEMLHVTWRDITERKQNETILKHTNEDLISLTAELEEQDEKLQEQIGEVNRAKREWEEIFQAIGNPALILDLNHRILDANNAILELSKKSLDELRTMYCWQLFHYPGDTQPPEGCPFEKMKVSGELETSEMKVEAFGEIYLVSCTPLFNTDGALDRVIHIATNITDRKHVDESLHEAIQKLRLLTGLTRHDIFNQLTVVQMLHDMALETSEPVKIKEYITRAQEAGTHIEATIGFTREYENFGSVSSGWKQIRLIIEAARTEIPLGNVIIENLIPEGLEVYADPIIRKVFSTLMDNAIRHGGGITRISISSHVRNNLLTIICADDGIGIPDLEKERIFDHGYGKNTGIGLFLSREILSITGLSIREAGKPGKGAKFEILVPTGKYRFQ